MRLLVFSDAHGTTHGPREALLAQPLAKHVFFLGDGARALEPLVEEFSDRTFYFVRGNCDAFADYPDANLAKVGGITVFYTHGHLYGADEEKMALTARLRGADLLLYGHTHVPRAGYVEGLHIVNPGSIARSRQGANSYAVIDVEPTGLMPVIIRI